MSVSYSSKGTLQPTYVPTGPPQQGQSSHQPLYIPTQGAHSPVPPQGQPQPNYSVQPGQQLMYNNTTHTQGPHYTTQLQMQPQPTTYTTLTLVQQQPQQMYYQPQQLIQPAQYAQHPQLAPLSSSSSGAQYHTQPLNQFHYHQQQPQVVQQQPQPPKKKKKGLLGALADALDDVVGENGGVSITPQAHATQPFSLAPQGVKLAFLCAKKVKYNASHSPCVFLRIRIGGTTYETPSHTTHNPVFNHMILFPQGTNSVVNVEILVMNKGVAFHDKLGQDNIDINLGVPQETIKLKFHRKVGTRRGGGGGHMSCRATVVMSVTH